MRAVRNPEKEGGFEAIYASLPEPLREMIEGTKTPETTHDRAEALARFIMRAYAENTGLMFGRPLDGKAATPPQAPSVQEDDFDDESAPTLRSDRLMKRSASHVDLLKGDQVGEYI